MDLVLQQIFEGIIIGDPNMVQKKVQEALDNKFDPSVVLDQGMIAAMDNVGKLYEQGDYFIPEMLLAAQAMQLGLEILRPHLLGANIKSIGTIVAGTVQGDLHDIGKNLVCLMFEGAGYDVHDLGIDVSPAIFVEAARTYHADLVAISALLTTTMVNMTTVIEAFDKSGQRDQVRIIVGGAPITDAFARQIGADGYAPDASRAVKVAKSLISGAN